MSELLPCPFCGGEAKWYASLGIGGYVACINCGAKTKERILQRDVENAWNTRHERTCNRVLYSGSALKNNYYGCSLCCAPLHETYRYCPNCRAKVVSE